MIDEEKLEELIRRVVSEELDKRPHTTIVPQAPVPYCPPTYPPFTWNC